MTSWSTKKNHWTRGRNEEGADFEWFTKKISDLKKSLKAES